MFNKQVGAACVSLAAAVFGMGLFFPQGQTLEARVSGLEERVAKLEAALAGQGQAKVVGAPAPAGETRAEKLAPLFVPVTITDRRFQPANAAEGRPQDGLWFDLTFDLTAVQKDVTMLRGLLEFRSLAGETKYQLSTTMAETMRAGSHHKARGKGFHFNPLQDEHRWVYSTPLRDMQVVLRVQEVLYADGVRAEHR